MDEQGDERTGRSGWEGAVRSAVIGARAIFDLPRVPRGRRPDGVGRAARSSVRSPPPAVRGRGSLGGGDPPRENAPAPSARGEQPALHQSLPRARARSDSAPPAPTC